MKYYQVDMRKQQFVHRVEWITMATVTALILIVSFLIDAWLDISLWWAASLAPLLFDKQFKAPFIGKDKKYQKAPLYSAGDEKLIGPEIKVDYYRIKAVAAESRPARLGLLSVLLGDYLPDHLLIVLTLDDNTIAQFDVTLLTDADQNELYQLLQYECRQILKVAS